MGPDGAGWIEVKKGSRVKTIKSPTTTYTALALNAYSVLSPSTELDCSGPSQTNIANKVHQQPIVRPKHPTVKPTPNNTSNTSFDCLTSTKTNSLTTVLPEPRMNALKWPRRTQTTSNTLPSTNSNSQRYHCFNAATTSVTTSAPQSAEPSTSFNQPADESLLPPSTLCVPTNSHEQANSVYHLPSIKQAIRWMHAQYAVIRLNQRGSKLSRPAISLAGLSSRRRMSTSIIPNPTRHDKAT